MKEDTESLPSKEVMKNPEKFSKWLGEQPWAAVSKRWGVSDVAGNTGLGYKKGKQDIKEKLE